MGVPTIFPTQKHVFGAGDLSKAGPRPWCIWNSPSSSKWSPQYKMWVFLLKPRLWQWAVARDNKSAIRNSHTSDLLIARPTHHVERRSKKIPNGLFFTFNNCIKHQNTPGLSALNQYKNTKFCNTDLCGLNYRVNRILSSSMSMKPPYQPIMSPWTWYFK